MKMVKPLPIAKEAKIPLHLIEQIREETALLFVGSGLSIDLGYPSWKELVSNIFERIESTLSIKDETNRKWLKEHFFTEPDWAAEVISSASHDEYQNALRSIFLNEQPKVVSLNHILISLLSFKGYLTTNYDTLIEDYLSVFSLHPPLVFDYIEALENYANFRLASRYVLKLHGSIKNSTESLVLTSSDYHKLLHDQRYIRLLASIFSEYTILCVGFSLRDRDFRFFLEERFHLYKKRCPPLYALIPEEETCPLEISLLQNKYNVHLIPISKQNSFAELTSFLFSLYCIVQREDSSVIGREFLDVAVLRVNDTGGYENLSPLEEPPEAFKAKKLLSVFKEPIAVNALIAICMESGIRLSSATCIAMADVAPSGRVFLKKPIIRLAPEDRKVVASWISSEFESIPVTDSPRHFTSYHKAIFGKYSKTISYLLRYEEGWNEIIGVDKSSTYRLIRVSQFFKQEGLWREWLDIANDAQLFLDSTSEICRDLKKSVLWVYFWTRRYDDAQELLRNHPELDEKEGEHNYTERLLYMRKDHIPQLIEILIAKESIDYFGLSLLGRAYARLYLLDNRRNEHLLNAKEYLMLALKGATEYGDWIERSVQSWYLSIVLSDLGDIAKAKDYLAEVRRLDESIMNRVPGLAWLDLAEYRLAMNDPEGTEFKREELRERAIVAFTRLGVVDIEQYIDQEYYY